MRIYWWIAVRQIVFRHEKVRRKLVQRRCGSYVLVEVSYDVSDEVAGFAGVPCGIPQCARYFVKYQQNAPLRGITGVPAVGSVAFRKTIEKRRQPFEVPTAE